MASRVVDILLPVALDQAYSYRVPDGMELAPGFGERALEADRGHYILELLACARMHVDVARGHANDKHAKI